VDVSPLLVIVAILIGSTLLGVLGALVAIPVAAALQIMVRDVWQSRTPVTIVETPGGG
jgi:predicted PurR-regulated permease PerM